MLKIHLELLECIATYAGAIRVVTRTSHTKLCHLYYIWHGPLDYDARGGSYAVKSARLRHLKINKLR